MKDLVEYIAKSLVDHPDEVSVTQIRGSQATVIKLRVAPDDKGWVIGRRGRVANAMRTLLRVSSSASGRRHAILEIV
jgi:hypothetical protein